jgi:SAM-dependent methyltransferase
MTQPPEDARAGVARFWGEQALRHVLAWPDENLARFVGTRFKGRAEGLRAVEIGCGNGRNVRLLALSGFEAHGVDISPEAAESCRGVMAATGTPATIHAGAFQDVLDPAEPFDLIVWDSPFIDTRAGMEAGFARAFDLLRPGGEMWTRFRHPDSWFSGAGEANPDGSMVLDARAGPYDGALYLFLDGDAGRAVLDRAGFETVNRERAELWKNGEAERHVWTIFWARRPA